ncbi:MAG: hypothetical protein RL146_918 [Actinomycetota bacterium]
MKQRLVDLAMEGEIEARAKDLGKLKVVTRTGDVTNPEDLKRTNIANAKSIIVLDSDEAGDANVVSAVLARCSCDQGSKPKHRHQDHH